MICGSGSQSRVSSRHGPSKNFSPYGPSNNFSHSFKICGLNKSTISLNGLEFNSKIGLLDYEKENGNTFIVNISVEVEVDKINYDDLSAVKKLYF